MSTYTKESIQESFVHAAGCIADIRILVEGNWQDTTYSPVARRAAAAALQLGANTGSVELSVLLTDDARMRTLNREFRALDRTTNVLAFPAETEVTSMPRLLGDVVVAYETAADEARAAEVPLTHHLSHLVVHGTLHLLGYDHVEDVDAEVMEALECRILAGLAIANPYAVGHVAWYNGSNRR